VVVRCRTGRRIFEESLMKRILLPCLLSLLSLGAFSAAPAPNRLTVKSALNPSAFRGKAPRSASWSPDGRHLFYVTEGKDAEREGLYVMDAETAARKLVLSKSRLIQAVSGNKGARNEQGAMEEFPGYTISPDGKNILLDAQSGFYLYTIESAKLLKLSVPDGAEGLRWSPDGSEIAWSTRREIQVLNLATSEVATLTRSEDPEIIVGAPDWLYAEELDVKKAFRWSPDGKSIAFLSFDERGVPTYPIIDETERNPKVRRQFYPKPGEKNPIVSLFVVDIAEGRSVPVPGASSGEGYLPRFTWLPNSKGLLFELLDRVQTTLTTEIFNLGEAKAATLFKERSSKWINVIGEPRFLKDGRRFLWLSEVDGYAHLYLRSLDGGTPVRLTSGPWVVDELLAVDEKGGFAYVSGNRDNPIGRSIFRVRLDGGGVRAVTSGYPWHDAVFSRDGRRFLDLYSNAFAPGGASLVDGVSGKRTTIAEGSAERSASYGFVKPEFFTLKGPGGTELHAMMVKPVGFMKGKRYPVVVEVYGGPGLQLVQDRWIPRWALVDQLFSQHGFIYFSIDNRGSARRGKKFEGAISGEFGKHELEDQLAGVAYLKKLSFVDPDRIGVWGWSYGGFMTLYSLTHTDAFSCGFAVAPVTDWLDYDTCYTERYMKLPRNNSAGYRKSSPVYAVSKLDVPLMIAQGLVDDNVHFQNSVRFVDAAYRSGRRIEMTYYPRMTHGIRGKAARLDLFRRILSFFEKNLRTGGATPVKGD